MHCGGIVADVMGLGKTLTVLTSILQSASDAEIFQNFDEGISRRKESKLRTKATLVVVSSARMFVFPFIGSVEGLIERLRATR